MTSATTVIKHRCFKLLSEKKERRYSENVAARSVKANAIDGRKVTENALVNFNGAEELGLYDIGGSETAAHVQLVQVEDDIGAAASTPHVTSDQVSSC
jgi:hypothetical protein